jgi:hypothetical protein
MSAIRNDKKPAFPANKEGGKLDLSVNKENLKHLKVRTDLKGGLLAQLAAPAATAAAEQASVNGRYARGQLGLVHLFLTKPLMRQTVRAQGFGWVFVRSCAVHQHPLVHQPRELVKEVFA